MKNIYFVGPAGCGKSICTKYLVEQYGYLSGKIALPLYSLAQNYFGMTKKDRKLLITIGTTAGREQLFETIWIERFLQDIKIVQGTYELLYQKEVFFVVDDVRHENEHLALQRSGWTGVYLNTPEELRLTRLKQRDGDAQIDTLQHKSETEHNNFKHELIEMDSSQVFDDLKLDLDILMGVE